MTEHTHCWHDNRYGKGGVTQDPDGAHVTYSSGTLICCDCGAEKVYEQRTRHKPTTHGPWNPARPHPLGHNPERKLQ
jgi:hypothetical protein